MKKTVSGLLLAATGALVFYLVVILPPLIIEQYARVSSFGPAWGYLYLAGIALGSMLLLGGLAWSVYTLWSVGRRERLRSARDSKEILEMGPREKEEAVKAYLEEAKALAQESREQEELKKAIERAASQLEHKQQEESFEVVAFGTISSGKSSVLNRLTGRELFESDVSGGTTVKVKSVEWPGFGRVRLVDTPGLAEIRGGKRGFDARSAAKKADLILFVLDGPLKDFEFRTIQDLHAMGKRLVVCLNKRDWFVESDLSLLLCKIRDQLKDYIPPGDIVPVQAEPVKRKRDRIKMDGSVSEEDVELAPEIDALASRLMEIINAEGKDLLLNNLLLQARGLRSDTLERIRARRDEKAVQKINQYTWKAAAAAAVSPTPFVDAAVGVAFSFKMILDLAAIYGRNVDLQAARELVGQLMKSLGASLGATSISPAVGQLFASALKGVPGIGTLAGGTMQGLVQALVTQWIGRVMKDYFSQDKAESAIPLDELARRHWEKLTSKSELINLAMNGRPYLKEHKDKEHGKSS